MAGQTLGLNVDNKDNQHGWDTLTANGSTPAAEVNATLLTIVHKVAGGTVTITDEGSLDGTNWWPLKEIAHAEAQAADDDDDGVHGNGRAHSSGTTASHYRCVCRYVRVTVSGVTSGESMQAWISCN